MSKKILSLGNEGKLVLKSPNGKVEDIKHGTLHYAYLVIDCSTSMEGIKLAEAKKGAMEFAKDALHKGYSLGLIQFASVAKHICETEANITAIRSHIEMLIAGGSTNMTDGIRLAIDKLSIRKGLNAMVIVTDGQPDNPNSALDIASEAKERGIDIIAIGTDDADKVFLNKLASRVDLAVKVSRDQLGQGIASAAKMLPKAN